MKKIILLISLISFIISLKAIESEQISKLNLEQLPIGILKDVVIKSTLVKEVSEKIELAKTLPELYLAIKDLAKFSRTSKKNRQIFKDLVEEKSKNSKSLKERFIEKKQKIIQDIKEKFQDYYPITNFKWLNDINDQDEDGFTILMYVAVVIKTSNFYWFKEVIKLLIQNGANINAQNKYGSNALMLSIRDSTKLSKLLIQNGTDVNAKDKEDHTALNYASALYHYVKNKDEIVELLIKNGAIFFQSHHNTEFHESLNSIKEIVNELIKKYGKDQELKNNQNNNNCESEFDYVGKRHECIIQ